MHEVGYVESLLPVVEARAAGRTVTRIGVRASVAHRLVEASMQQALDLVATGTVAAGATIEVEQIPLTITCPSCATAAESPDPAMVVCASCGGMDLRRSGADEFTLAWLALATDAPEDVSS